MQMNFLAKNANAKLQKVCRLKQKTIGTQQCFAHKNSLLPAGAKKAAPKIASTQPNIMFNYLVRRL